MVLCVWWRFTAVWYSVCTSKRDTCMCVCVQGIMPGPPFAFGAILVILALIVALFIPENPHAHVKSPSMGSRRTPPLLQPCDDDLAETSIVFCSWFSRRKQVLFNQCLFSLLPRVKAESVSPFLLTAFLVFVLFWIWCIIVVRLQFFCLITKHFLLVKKLIICYYMKFFLPTSCS